MRVALKAIPLAVLGFAAAFLVACGDRSGLLSGQDAANLQDALASVQSACADGQMADAALAARRFSDRVTELSPRRVDPRLIANLAQGAQTLDALVARTCTATTTIPTTSTATTAPATTDTTTIPTTTTDTTTVPTTPTTTPTTPTTTPTEPPPSNGGGTPGDGDDNGPPGGVPPGQAKKNGGAGATP
jgi:hypothetical protein